MNTKNSVRITGGANELVTPPANNELEKKIEKFVLTPAMARLFSAETLLMATGRLGEYEGKTVREELKDLLASERAKERIKTRQDIENALLSGEMELTPVGLLLTPDKTV